MSHNPENLNRGSQYLYDSSVYPALCGNLYTGFTVIQKGQQCRMDYSLDQLSVITVSRTFGKSTEILRKGA